MRPTALAVGLLSCLTLASGLAAQTGKLDSAPAPDSGDAELERWLIGQFGAQQAGLQQDGSAIVCQIGTDLEKAMLDIIVRLKSLMGQGGRKKFDVRILKLDRGRLDVCIKATRIRQGLLRLHPTDRLHVNSDLQHYRVRKSRREGEKDLFELCRVTEREENFIYVKYAGGTEEWYECGVKETAETASIDLKVMGIISREKKKIKEISFYHHHPIERVGHQDSSQTPSEKDVQGFVEILELIHHNDPHLVKKLDFCVVTSSGIHVFKLSPRVLRSRRARAKVLRIGSRIDVYRTRSKAYYYRNQKDFAKENLKFARRFNSRLLKLRFIPAPEDLHLAKLEATEAQKLDLYIRAADEALYEVFYNPELNRMILKNQTEPVLYDEKGNRIGYAGPAGEFVFATPPGGWPKKYSRKIKLDIYQEVEEKMMEIKVLTK